MPRMRKESAGLKWNAVFAVPVILLVALLGSRMALAGEMINVIPQPAHAESRQGSFAIRAGTRIAVPRDPRAARVAWRGLMLDSARHYQSPEFILKFIDWMALHKLNVFHWHLTDDQAWRLEIKKYPRLTSVGAWRVPAGAAPASDIDPATGRPR